MGAAAADVDASLLRNHPIATATARQPSPWGPYLPKWAPTWDMRNSTILYACNYSGPVQTNKVVSF